MKHVFTTLLSLLAVAAVAGAAEKVNVGMFKSANWIAVDLPKAGELGGVAGEVVVTPTSQWAALELSNEPINATAVKAVKVEYKDFKKGNNKSVFQFCIDGIKVVDNKGITNKGTGYVPFDATEGTGSLVLELTDYESYDGETLTVSLQNTIQGNNNSNDTENYNEEGYKDVSITITDVKLVGNDDKEVSVKSYGGYASWGLKVDGGVKVWKNYTVAPCEMTFNGRWCAVSLLNAETGIPVSYTKGQGVEQVYTIEFKEALPEGFKAQITYDLANGGTGYKDMVVADKDNKFTFVVNDTSADSNINGINFFSTDEKDYPKDTKYTVKIKSFTCEVRKAGATTAVSNISVLNDGVARTLTGAVAPEGYKGIVIINGVKKIQK